MDILSSNFDIIGCLSKNKVFSYFVVIQKNLICILYVLETFFNDLYTIVSINNANYIKIFRSLLKNIFHRIDELYSNFTHPIQYT